MKGLFLVGRPDGLIFEGLVNPDGSVVLYGTRSANFYTSIDEMLEVLNRLTPSRGPFSVTWPARG